MPNRESIYGARGRLARHDLRDDARGAVRVRTPYGFTPRIRRDPTSVVPYIARIGNGKVVRCVLRCRALEDALDGSNAIISAVTHNFKSN
eukprot:2001604-Prymnesium_polylepis.1